MLSRKKSLFAASVISLTLGVASLSTAQAESHEKMEDAVIAVVNGENILKSTLDGYLALLVKQKQSRPDPESALNDLIATEIALQEAKKSDILDRPESKKALEDFTRNILLQTWTKDKIASFTIDDVAIKEAYDERVTKLSSQEFNARHILVKTEEEAKAIIVEANAEGADFAEIAKEKSTGPSGSNGGSLGWFKAQTMVPAFANAVKTMAKGSISDQPVKTQFGFHVIKLEDSRQAKLPTLDSLKPQLERVISQKKMLSHMDELKKAADIKINLPTEVEAEKKMDDENHDNSAENTTEEK